MSYIVKSQGYDGGPEFETLKEAEDYARDLVAEDKAKARRSWSSAHVARHKGRGFNFWEVRANRDERSPRWSLISIAEIR